MQTETYAQIWFSFRMPGVLDTNESTYVFPLTGLQTQKDLNRPRLPLRS